MIGKISILRYDNREEYVVQVSALSSIQYVLGSKDILILNDTERTSSHSSDKRWRF
jgi:hypothetical protein